METMRHDWFKVTFESCPQPTGDSVPMLHLENLRCKGPMDFAIKICNQLCNQNELVYNLKLYLNFSKAVSLTPSVEYTMFYPSTPAGVQLVDGFIFS